MANIFSKIFRNKENLIIAILALACLGGGIFFYRAVNASKSRPKAAAGGSLDGMPLQKDPVEIKLTESGFNPANLAIQKGQAVRFAGSGQSAFWPASDLHPTHLIYPEFDPKKEIEPGASWTFIFDKAGKWRYHDHLRPNFTGVITVLDGSFAKKAVSKAEIEREANNCLPASLKEKQQCWNDQLEWTVDNRGLDAAFELFIALYQTEPSIPKSCHGWAHVLGRAGFDLYKDRKNFILRPEVSYCGYGFFHGFMEQLLLTTGDIKPARDFCVYAADQLKADYQRAYINCIHGIGHGSVNVDDPKLWGNFQAMIDPGLKICEAALTKLEDLRECFDGAFNAMHLYAFNGEYKLIYNRKDPFWLCRKQEEKYQISCYFEFAGSLSSITGHDFIQAAKIIDAIPNKEIALITMSKSAADFMEADIANPDQMPNILNCRKLPKYLYDMCVDGVILGFIAHGEPEHEYVKGLAFCKLDSLTNDEREACYAKILRVLVKKGSPVCGSVDEKYRHYCHE